MNDSMHRHQTAKSLATSIVLLRSDPRNRNKTILLVEGGDDEEIFRRFIDATKCHIQIGGDKERVIRGVQILDNNQQRGIIAIVDAGFDIISGRAIVSQNLIFTDCHDMEAMIVSSNSYGDYIQSLVPPTGTKSPETIAVIVRQCILQIARPVGLLRYISHRSNLSLSLNNFRDFVIVERRVIDLDRLIVEGLRIATGKPPDKRQVAKIQNDLDTLGSELSSEYEWYIYRGHDLTSLTVWALNIVFEQEFPAYDRTLGFAGQVDTKKNVEKNLRRTYDSRYFRRTKLYSEIRNWEKRNVPFLVLALDI